jgi:hypothetical protein
MYILGTLKYLIITGSHTTPPDPAANAFQSLFMMLMDALYNRPAGVSMFTNKKVKRRDPIAFDLLVSGTYKSRKVKSKRDYKRNFKNFREFDHATSF